jgi:hypothetical protein
MNISRSMASVFLSAYLVFSLAGCAPMPQPKTNPEVKVTTEADLVRQLGYSIDAQYVDNSPTVFPAAIYPWRLVNVRVYRDVDEPLATYKTYNFDYSSKTNPLLEKELFHQLDKILQSQGMTRDKENPQITITMDFYTGKKEQSTPPTTITSTEVKEVWNTGMIGWNMMGMSSQVPVTTSTTSPGYTTTSYYSNIRLNFLNHAKLVAETKPEIPPLLWMGEADNEGQEPDIRNISPILLGQLAGEFPAPTEKGAKRFMRRFRYGGLGLGFLTTDWRVISYVEPNSVAAAKGLKAGDMILKINGKSAFSVYTHSQFPSQSGNPYVKYVLCNQGDKDVELLIQSVETGEKVTLKMRPRLEDRMVLVDMYGIPLGN